MTPRKGPTKKLAPTIRAGTGCPHVYSEEDGLQLEIDCVSCKGAHDLNNKQCLSAVLNILVAGAQPEVIILKRFAHKRYRGRAVKIASLAASQLATLNRALASINIPSDRHCRTCAASRQNLLTSMKQHLIENPTTYVANHPELATLIRTRLGHVDCERREACILEALSAGSRPVEALR